MSLAIIMQQRIYNATNPRHKLKATLFAVSTGKHNVTARVFLAECMSQLPHLPLLKCYIRPMTTMPDAINIAKKAYIQYMASRSEPDSTDLTNESFSLCETYIPQYTQNNIK